MKIAILGSGALGSVTGARLHIAGHAVTLLDRNRDHIDAINAQGLRVDLDDGSQTLPIPAMQPEALDGADLIILLTKTYQSVAALKSVAGVISSGAHVLTIQNGLGNVERVSSIVPIDRVLFGSTMTPADYIAPGHVASLGSGQTTYWPAAGGPCSAQFVDALAKGGLMLDPAAPVVVWQKAAFNCAMNACAMLGEGTVGDIADHVGPVLASKTAEEVIALARAEGISADLAEVEHQIEYAMAEHRRHKPSMLQDLEAGRPSEIEALNGHVAKRAPELGLDAPLNALLAALVRMKERNRLV